MAILENLILIDLVMWQFHYPRNIQKRAKSCDFTLFRYYIYGILMLFQNTLKRYRARNGKGRGAPRRRVQGAVEEIFLIVSVAPNPLRVNDIGASTNVISSEAEKSHRTKSGRAGKIARSFFVLKNGSVIKGRLIALDIRLEVCYNVYATQFYFQCGCTMRISTTLFSHIGKIV